MKKMKNCKQVLLCGTLSLCLLGGIPQVVTTATAGTLSAQQEGKKVTGTVTDAMGPVIGASVMVKGTTTGSLTDIDGNFTLTAPRGATLVISYIGYKTVEVKVGDGPVNVTLEEDTKLLDEVVTSSTPWPAACLDS